MFRWNDARLARVNPCAESLEQRICLAVFLVTNTSDNTNAGSLRRAILDANTALGPDEIRFDPAVFSTPQTITIISPPTPPQIQGQLTITGPGASLLTVTRAGGRVLDSFASTLAISGLTITGGSGGGLNVAGISPDVTLDSVVFTGNSTTGDGGGVALNNNATLTVRNCVFSGNTARMGGAIFFFQNGSLLMDNCTISSNTATGLDSHNNSGGGLYFSGTARATPPPAYTPNTLVIRNSTFSGNTARGGGGMGIDALTGTLLIENSTISGNTAAISGGGIQADPGSGTITLQNSTVTANTANGTTTGTGGGGISRTSITANTLNLINSVVSGNNNSRAPDIRTDGFTRTNVNFSAVGSSAGFTLSGTSGNNLPFGTNPMLGALANNGGPTLTHALLSGSPLINAGSNAAVPAGMAYDQRGAGFPRIVGAAVDIGAYERPGAVAATVVGRLVFYNHSSFDGNDAAAGAADDAAVATDKRAWLGGAAAFANVTSFDKGINGVMVDIANLPTNVALAAGDFSFGAAVPQPTSVSVRRGAGAGGSDRVTLVWPDYSPLNPALSAVAQGWLTVTVKANSHTGLAAPDVFSFGNLIGETGDGGGAAGWRVSALDVAAVKHDLNMPTSITSRSDFNRDGRVNALDVAVVKKNLSRSLAPTPAPVATPMLAAADRKESETFLTQLLG